MQQEYLRCFPWSAEGPLCPVLEDPTVWLKVFDRGAVRHAAKIACKSKEHRVVPTANPERFGALLLGVLSEPKRRDVLAQQLKKAKCPPLHTQMVRAFWREDTELREVWPLRDCCRASEDEVWFLDLDRFGSWLAERRYTPEQTRSIAIVACGFALLQPSDANAILGLLMQHDRRFARWLLPSASAAPLSDPTGSAEVDIATVEASETAHVVVTIPPSNASNPFDSEELSRGELLLTAFLEAQRQVHESIKRLSSRVDNLPCANAMAGEVLAAEFAKALAHSTSAGAEAESWLAMLMSALETGEVERLTAAEPALKTLQAHAAQSRETRDLLRNACEEIGKILRELDANATVRAQSLASVLSEIRSVDDLLGRPRFQPSIAAPTNNLLQNLRLQVELDAQVERARAERDNYFVNRKRELQEHLDEIVSRYDIALSGPNFKEQVESLRALIQTCETSGALTAAQQTVNEFQNVLRRNPETRNLDELAREALIGKPVAETVLPVAKALNARGRASEALALLTCLQVAHVTTGCGLSDFSELVDVLMRISAEVANRDLEVFQWIDGVFQQPWVRALRRSDVQNHSTWQRLAVALVVQDHLRGTEQELDLIFRLDLKSALPRKRFPTLYRCLNGIATRHPVKILQEAPPSPRRDVDQRLEEFFKRNDYGDYLEQAAAGGDGFYVMERFHLFPAMERTLKKVRQLCSNADWGGARKVADSKPDRMLNDACRAANINPDESVYYRRKVLDAQTGYLPIFLKELKQLISAAQRERGLDVDFVIAADVLNEVAHLAEQEPNFDSFWVTVSRTFQKERSTAVGASSGEEMFARLSGKSAEVITLASEYVVARCKAGPSYKPSDETLVQMLGQLAAPSEDYGLSRLQDAQCYRHARVLLDQFAGKLPSETPTIRREVRAQIDQYEEQLSARIERLNEHPAAELNQEECKAAFEDGCFAYLNKVLSDAEARVKRASDDARGHLQAWLETQEATLSTLKKTAVATAISEAWLSTVLQHCADLEKLLLFAARDLSQEKPLTLNQAPLENAIVALRFVVENGAHSFSEIESYLAQVNQTSIPSVAVVKEGSSFMAEIAQPWELLRSMPQPETKQAGALWQELVRGFCNACRLYHDLHNTLTFAAIEGYRWGQYITAFHNPRSSWLDRKVRLYLCFGEKTPASELETLAIELDKNRDNLNLVFVPQGLARLARLWKYDPFRSPYLLVGEELLTKISGCCDADGGWQHDVPLRQALHQTAENLTGIGLFKSEGYVHFRKNIFVGRRDALQQLRQQPASVIWGGRRTGKTSLLQALSESLRSTRVTDGPYSVALVYGDKVTDDPDLAIACAIAQELRLPEPRNLMEFEGLIMDACMQHRVAVLIDEMDRYIELSRKVHGPTSFPLARTLRGLSQRDSTRFKLVYAGFKQLYYEVRMRPGADPSDPFKNIVKPVMKDFRDLDLREVEELMRIGFVEMLGIEMDPSVPRLVTEKTSGHPAFVQRFCERLLVRVSQRRKFDSRLCLAATDVENTYLEDTPSGSDDTAFIDYVNETLGWNVSHLERAILLALSFDIRSSNSSERRDYSDQQILEQLRFWCDADIPVPDMQDFQNALTMLSMTKMLTPVSSSGGQRYRITYPAYIDFMSRLDQLGKVEIFKSLGDYQNEEKGLIR